MNSVKKLFYGIVMILTFHSQSYAHVFNSSNYDFLTHDPYIASSLSALFPSQIQLKTHSFKYLLNRPGLPIFNKKNEITMAYLPQPKSSPLAIILSGVGGSPFSPLSTSYAEFLYQQGYSVITLPSTLTWQYTLAVSKSAKPGYFPIDAIEYYDFLKKILNVASKQLKINFANQNILLTGYSNGATLTGFIAHQDLLQTTPLFSQYILFNPAIDVIYGISQLDQLRLEGVNYSETKKENLKGLVFEFLEKKSNLPSQKIDFLKFINDKNITQKNIKWFIGETYHDDLNNILLVSHYLNPETSIFNNIPSSKHNLNSLYNVFNEITFQDYLSHIILPEYKFTPDNILAIKQSNLDSLYSTLSNSKNVFIFHNEDDFLIKNNDIKLIEESFQDNAFIFPYGGHLGNMLDDIHLKILKQILLKASSK